MNLIYTLFMQMMAHIDALVEELQSRDMKLAAHVVRMVSNLAREMHDAMIEHERELQEDLSRVERELGEEKSKQPVISKEDLAFLQRQAASLIELQRRVNAHFLAIWPDEYDLLKSGKDGSKIEAIKLYKQRTGVNLKEAKDAIESYAKEFCPEKPEQPPGLASVMLNKKS